MKRIAKLLLLILVGIFFLNFLTNKKGAIVFLKPNLKEVVEKSMAGAKGRYGIYIKNLKTGESYFSKEEETFDAGSLYKPWLMEKVFEQIKAGEIKEDDILSADIADLNRQFGIDPDTAELTQGRIELTVKSAIDQTITISHNYAALLLLDKVGDDKIPTKITPKEVGMYFEKLYNGETIDKEYSAKMLEILTRNKISDRIPKLLPEGTRVAHKTADLGFFEHDGGIVFSEKGDYIIVVLSETDSPQAAGDRIANLSQAVFKYFNNLSPF